MNYYMAQRFSGNWQPCEAVTLRGAKQEATRTFGKFTGKTRLIGIPIDHPNNGREWVVVSKAHGHQQWVDQQDKHAMKLIEAQS